MEPVVFEKVKMVSGKVFVFCGWPQVCLCVCVVGLTAYCTIVPGAKGFHI